MSYKQAHTDRSIKIKWLAAHRELWEGWIHTGDPRKRMLVESMKAADLLSKSTYWKDVSLNNMIQDARKLLREERQAKG